MKQIAPHINLPIIRFFLLNTFLYFFYLKHIITFRRRAGYFPNIALPVSYHEKMLWRKIFDHNPLFVVFGDKLATKAYTQSLIPDAKIPKTLWAGDDITNAPQELFDQDVFVKANHGSKFNRLIKKGTLNIKELQKLTRKWLRKKHGKVHLEWGYFKVKRKIFIEELIASEDDFFDLSLNCIDGKVLFIRFVSDMSGPGRKNRYYDINGKRLYPPNFKPENDAESVEDICSPKIFFDAIKKAEILSRGIDYARFDFMTDGKELYGGEITVYPLAGLPRIVLPGEIDQETIINEAWDLKKSWFLTHPQTGWKKWYANTLQ